MAPWLRAKPLLRRQCHKGTIIRQTETRAAYSAKLPQERPMLCTDVEIDAKLPEAAFVKAYNQIISNRKITCSSLNE